MRFLLFDVVSLCTVSVLFFDASAHLQGTRDRVIFCFFFCQLFSISNLVMHSAHGL